MKTCMAEYILLHVLLYLINNNLLGSKEKSVDELRFADLFWSMSRMKKPNDAFSISCCRGVFS